MAARNLVNPLVFQRRCVLVPFSFAPNGTGAVSQASIKGPGVASVARDSAGVFTITFADKFNDLISAHGVAMLASAADITVQFGAFTQASKTLVLRTVAVATPTDVAADANNRIQGFAVFRDTSLTK